MNNLDKGQILNKTSLVGVLKRSTPTMRYQKVNRNYMSRHAVIDLLQLQHTIPISGRENFSCQYKEGNNFFQDCNYGEQQLQGNMTQAKIFNLAHLANWGILGLANLGHYFLIFAHLGQTRERHMTFQSKLGCFRPTCVKIQKRKSRKKNAVLLHIPHKSWYV